MKTQKNPIRILGATLLLFALGLPQTHAYTHPGAPLSLSDLQTLKANVNQGKEPWKSGYAALAGDGRSSLSYTMQGPFTNVSRSPNVNLNQWRSDMIAIWNLSRMWYFTGNEAYAQKAHDILLTWANTQTSFTGSESMLDLGDYAYRFVGGADILRGTWPGWTEADTTAVKNYFGNVLMPASNPYGESQFGAANKGALALVSLGLLAIFNDDTAKLNEVVYQLRTLAHIGLRSSNDIGMLGDSLRDQGHAHGQLFSLVTLAEALWKQGIDVYSDSNNRLLAAGEYFARVNDLAPTPFLPFGTTDAYYIADNTNRGWGGGHIALNLIHGAYVVRKGLPAPYTDLRRQELPVNGDSFMFLKDADPSAATPPTAPTIPVTTSITSGFSEVEIGGASPTGGASYSGGTWTVQGGGSEMWGTTNDSCHFTYKAITGDCSIIAKVESVQNTSLSAKAGVMMRTSLSQGSPRAWMAVTPRVQFEQNIQGLAVYGGTNYSNRAYNIPSASYWVKLERLGNIVTGYVSPDGTNWAATDVGRFNGTPPDTLYVGLVVCSTVNGTLNTSTFSNVQITGGNGGAPVVPPAAPAALLASPGENAVPLRWQPSFGATSYTIKRATSSGGAYSTVASGIPTSSYTDTTANSGTTYYYVVTATNSAGTSGNSPEDSVTPQVPMVNVAFGGAPNDSGNNPNGTQGAAKAFDLNVGSKWLGSAISWLQYDFGAGNAQTIKRYTVTSANDVPTRDPKDWQFQGSNDGSNWATLDTRGNQSFGNRFEAKTYAIASPAAYRYYRLNVTANGGDSSTQLSELGLFTDVGRTIPDGTYRVLSRRSLKAIGADGGATSNGTALDQWDYFSSDNQKWTFADQGNGQYKITGVGSGRVMDVSGISTANGAQIHLWDWLNANNQKWTVTPIGNGSFKLTAVHSGKVADVNGGSTANGATIIQWTYGGATNQQWLISTAP
jgi:regulation of enolase protein 1 (concanavalin A-like superfamily)